MPREFVMRGQTASAGEEVLNFSGYKPGYAYRLVEFQIYPSTNVATSEFEGAGAITAAKTAEDPINPNFENEGLIGTAACLVSASSINPATSLAVVNDKFLVTQNLILSVRDTSGNPINWQCRFVAEKMTGPEEAAVNYKQFSISDG